MSPNVEKHYSGLTTRNSRNLAPKRWLDALSLDVGRPSVGPREAVFDAKLHAGCPELSRVEC